MRTGHDELSFSLSFGERVTTFSFMTLLPLLFLVFPVSPPYPGSKKCPFRLPFFRDRAGREFAVFDGRSALQSSFKSETSAL